MLKHKKIDIQIQKGFLLLEAMIAILIFAMGVIALIGLQAIMLRDSIQSKYRNDAGYLANAIIGQMMTDKVNFASYANTSTLAQRTGWDAEVAAQLPNASTSITIAGSSVTVVVSWRTPEELAANAPAHNYTSVSQVVF